jgi:predicted nucleic acid-binding protein
VRSNGFSAERHDQSRRGAAHAQSHYGLTVYDAGYLEFAQRFSLAFATLDEGLITAARAEHVTLIGD